MKTVRGKLIASPEIIKLDSGKNKTTILVERPNGVRDIFCVLFGENFNEARKSAQLISIMQEIKETLDKFITYVDCEEYENQIREAKRLINLK